MPLTTDTTESRFWAKVAKTDGCWNWTAFVNPDGYGRFRTALAHRVSYEWANGPIPQGMTVDHMCFNRRCVRVEHLRAVSRRINCQNRKGANPSTTKSGHRGVHKTPSGKWQAKAVKDGHAYYAGVYSNIEDAVAAVTALRAKLYKAA